MTLPTLPLTHRPQPAAHAIFDQVSALGELFRANAGRAREERMVPQENIDALKDAGFFLALQPKRWGGFEVSPQDFFRMHLAIAENCMSTAWAAGIVAVHAFQIALMDERAQEEVWGEDIHARASSAYAPMGKVTEVEGGFRFSGRWGWSSGSDHCTWALLGGVCPDGGYRTFLVPRSDYEIVDTWHVMGLQGTGSKDIVVEDAFVPDYRTHKAEDGFQGTNPGVTGDSAPLYHLPWAQLFVRVVCTPAIGAARDAVDIYRRTVLGKASGDVTKLAGDTATQERVAAAVNTLDELEAVLFSNFDRMMEQVSRGEQVPVLERIKYRYQASLVIERCMSVIDSLFSSAGGSSVFLGNELQQRFIDIHTGRAHVANNPTTFARNFGSVLLGAESTDFFV